VLKGTVTAKQVEDEFQRILPSAWQWTARRIVDNIFTVRFPNAQLIKEWECFNPISMKAKIQVEPWNGSIGAKGKLQDAWFRVRVVPYDKRSEETLAYMGSLVGRTLEVDKSTLSRVDYVRVRIGARDVSKVPEVAEGSIGLYLYDFFFEREIVLGEYKEAHAVNVFAEKGGQSSPKKLQQGESSNKGPAQSAPQPKSPMVGQKSNSKQVSITLDRLLSGSQSVPTKLGGGSVKKIGQDICDNEKGNTMRFVEKDLNLLDPNEDRVQGLSGADFNTSEDDLLSDDTQGSQTVQQPSNEVHKVGLSRCSNSLGLLETNSEQAIDDGEKEVSNEDKIAKVNSEQQKIPDTRFSERVQAQLEKKELTQMANPKKRSLSGTNLNSYNSFAALDNEKIAEIACDMGVDISFANFDSIDIMKDLEAARHSLKNVEISKLDPNESNVQVLGENGDELPLLEWIDEDSEEEQFVLVQSTKKKETEFE
jgi:hypothetical protein